MAPLMRHMTHSMEQAAQDSTPPVRDTIHTTCHLEQPLPVPAEASPCSTSDSLPIPPLSDSMCYASVGVLMCVRWWSCSSPTIARYSHS